MISPERRREIRRTAARWAAAELDAIADDFADGKTTADYPDEEERAEFMGAIDRIIRHLKREGTR